MSDLFFDALRAALDDAAPRIVRETCPYCIRGKVEVRDTSSAFPTLATCWACAGNGWITVERERPKMRVRCGRCDGTGRTPISGSVTTCGQCNGKGYINMEAKHG